MDLELDGVFRHNTTYYYEDYEYKEDYEAKGSEAVLIPLVYSVELVVGLLGNGLLLAVLAQKRRSWSLSDTFILHLSIADILLLVTLPLWAAQAGQRYGWCFGGFLCKFSQAVFNINFLCGILLLLCITLDCYLSIVRTNQLYSKKRPRLAHISCLLVWLSSLILTIPDWIFTVASKDPSGEKTLCVYNYSESESHRQLVFRMLHHALVFLLPATVLIICCSCILLRLQQRSQDLRKLRAVTVLLPLVVVFFLCWMPYNITLIVDTSRSSSKEPDVGFSKTPRGSLKTALMVTSALGCSHACLRPLLYFGLCRNFREQMLAMLRRSAVESESSLWELGVGRKALPDQSHEGKELNQMTSADPQVPSTHC